MISGLISGSVISGLISGSVISGLIRDLWPAQCSTPPHPPTRAAPHCPRPGLTNGSNYPLHGLKGKGREERGGGAGGRASVEAIAVYSGLFAELTSNGVDGGGRASVDAIVAASRRTGVAGAALAAFVCECGGGGSRLTMQSDCLLGVEAVV